MEDRNGAPATLPSPRLSALKMLAKLPSALVLSQTLAQTEDAADDESVRTALLAGAQLAIIKDAFVTVQQLLPPI